MFGKINGKMQWYLSWANVKYCSAIAMSKDCKLCDGMVYTQYP